METKKTNTKPIKLRFSGTIYIEAENETEARHIFEERFKSTLEHMEDHAIQTISNTSNKIDKIIGDSKMASGILSSVGKVLNRVHGE